MDGVLFKHLSQLFQSLQVVCTAATPLGIPAHQGVLGRFVLQFVSHDAEQMTSRQQESIHACKRSTVHRSDLQLIHG